MSDTNQRGVDDSDTPIMTDEDQANEITRQQQGIHTALVVTTMGLHGIGYVEELIYLGLLEFGASEAFQDYVENHRQDMPLDEFTDKLKQAVALMIDQTMMEAKSHMHELDLAAKPKG